MKTAEKGKKSSIDRVLIAASIIDQFRRLVAKNESPDPAASITYGQRDDRRWDHIRKRQRS